MFGFSIFLEYGVSWGFLFFFIFCQSNFRRQGGEELAGSVVRPVYNIVKMIVFRSARYGAKWSNQEIRSVSQWGASLHESLDSQQLVYYILRGAQECSSGSRHRCIPSGRRYTMFRRETGRLKCSLSRTTTAVPRRQGRQNRRDAEARPLWTFCREHLPTTKMCSETRPIDA